MKDPLTTLAALETEDGCRDAEAMLLGATGESMLAAIADDRALRVCSGRMRDAQAGAAVELDA